MAKSGLDKVVRHICRVSAEEHWRSQADGELLRAFVRRRDQDAFAVLVKRYGPLVLATCRRVLRQLEDAEDAFQATFIVLARRAHALAKNGCLAGWLHRVAHRLALNARRALERRHHHERQSTAMNPTNPEWDAAWREVQVLLDDEIQRLPERYRDPFILCALGGQSCASAAQQLGLKEGTVWSRLAEARKRLQAHLSRRGVELTAVLGAAALAPGVATAQVAPALMAKAVSAATSATVPASVSALVKGLTASLAIKKAKVCIALFLVFSGLVGTTSMWAVQERAGQKVNAPPALAAGKQEAAAKAEPAVAKDIHGDPLPPGAVMRLGTVRLRAMGANLAWTPDGKTLVGVSGGSFLTFWHAASGRLKETRILSDEARFDSLLSADGQLLLSETLDVWDVSTGKLLNRLDPAKPAKDWAERRAFSKDTGFVAAVTRKDSQFLIRCWNLKTGKETFKSTVPRKEFECSEFISFSPDGKRLLVRLSGSPAVVGTYCWNLANGKLLWRHKETFNLIFNRPPCFSADGKYLLSVQPPLDLASGKAMELDTLPRLEQGHFIAVPDGRTLLIVTKDGVLVWDMQAAKQVTILAGAGDEMILAPDGKSLITNNGSLQRWDLATGKPLFADNFNDGHRQEVTDLLYSADGKKLASAGVDGSVRLWDTSTGRAIKVWSGHDSRRSVGDPRSLTAGVTALGMTPDARLIVSAGSEERLRVWQTDNEKDISTISLPSPPPGQSHRRVYHIRILPEVGKIMALYSATFLAGLEGQEFDSRAWLATWDIQSGNLLTKRALGGADPSYRFSRDGMTILSSSGVINSYSKETVPLKGANLGGNTFAAAFASDGSLVTADSGHITEGVNYNVNYPDGMCIWETATGSAIWHNKSTSPYWHGRFAFHPSCRYLAADMDDTIQVWDLVAKKSVASIKVPKGEQSSGGWYASALTFSPTGRQLATGHADGNIYVWNLDLPEPKLSALSSSQVESLWTDLGDTDAGKAWDAVWRLVDSPVEVLPVLRKYLKPVAVAPDATTGPLLADLESDLFTKREAAAKRLKELGMSAESALRGRLKTNPPLEAQRRIEALLKLSVETPEPLTPELLRQLRAVAVLTRIKSPQARDILESLTTGAESARLTCAASAAVRW